MEPTRRLQGVLLGALVAMSFVSVTIQASPSPLNPISFQQGVNGYTGQVDTQIRRAGVQSPAPATDDSGLDPINSDNQDGIPAGRVQALIRFNDIIGNGPGQIPAGTLCTRLL